MPAPPTTTEARALRLIEKIYLAATDPTAWPQFLNDLGAICEANTSLLLQDERAHLPLLLVTGRFDAAWVKTYREHYWSVNPWTVNLHRSPRGIACTDQALFDRRDLVRSEFYNDWLKPQGNCGGVTVCFHEEDGRILNLGLHSPSDDVIDNSLSLVQALAPHLARAAQIHRQLGAEASERSLAEVALNRLSTGIFLLGETGMVKFANRAAERIVRSANALKIDAGRRLRAAHTDDNRALTALVAGVTRRSLLAERSGGTLVVRCSASGRRYAVLVAPLAADDPAFLWATAPGAVVFVTDPWASERLPAEELGPMLGMTAAEARTAIAISAGRTVNQAAEDFGVSVNTIRSQLKIALATLGLHRQVDLARLISRIASLRGE